MELLIINNKLLFIILSMFLGGYWKKYFMTELEYVEIEFENIFIY